MQYRFAVNFGTLSITKMSMLVYPQYWMSKKSWPCWCMLKIFGLDSLIIVTYWMSKKSRPNLLSIDTDHKNYNIQTFLYWGVQQRCCHLEFISVYHLYSIFLINFWLFNYLITFSFSNDISLYKYDKLNSCWYCVF